MRSGQSGAHGTLVRGHQIDATLVALIPAEGGLEEGINESDGLVVAVLALSLIHI